MGMLHWGRYTGVIALGPLQNLLVKVYWIKGFTVHGLYVRQVSFYAKGEEEKILNFPARSKYH